MKQVFAAQHPAEAHLVKGLLESAGIAAEVRGEDLFGARGSVPTTPETLPSVWIVNDDDAALALAILTDYGRTGGATHQGHWRCPVCAEHVEAQFTECWRCGGSRPGP